MSGPISKAAMRVFDSDAAPGSAQRAIPAAIKARFGFRPGLVLMGAERLITALAQNPVAQAAEAPTTLHLIFTAGLRGVDWDEATDAAGAGEALLPGETRMCRAGWPA